MTTVVNPSLLGDVPAAVNAVFGMKLRLARRSRDVTQGELAARVDLSRVTIANIEGGKQNVQLHHVFLFAKALDVPIDHLLPTDHDLEKHQHGLKQVRSDHVAMSDVIFLQDARAQLTAMKGNFYGHQISDKTAD